MRRLGVGIIGMAPGRSWSAVAIAPAVRALPDYALVAVGTRQRESAEAAARAFSIPHAFDRHQALIDHPDVDVVVVAVRVPAHFELIRAALAAGKHVYCEWPLARNAAEGEALAALARRSGVRAFCGLQLRSAPFVRYLRDLILQGYVGEVRSSALSCAGLLCGRDVAADYAYTLDAANGANMLTVNFGHAIDTVLHVLDQGVASLSATTATLGRTARVVETGEAIPMTSEDQVAVTGALTSGAVFSAHLWGGPAATGERSFQWHVRGTEGDLRITAPAIDIQVGGARIEGARRGETMRRLPVPARYATVRGIPDGPAGFVAEAFAAMARDIRDGTSTCPGFDDAVARLRLLAAIRESARSGRRIVPL